MHKGRQKEMVERFSDDLDVDEFRFDGANSIKKGGGVVDIFSILCSSRRRGEE